MFVVLSSAHGQDGENPITFAPGATGKRNIPVMEMLNGAKELGNRWKQELNIQKPNDFGKHVDVEELRERALNNPRVRALLNADGGSATTEGNEPRYGNDKVFLLVSFSMPEQILRTAMKEAARFNVPIVVRGFVNNSAFDTQTAIQRVFKDDAESIGFGIDPTLFTRFSVETVPQLIVTRERLEVCSTQGCEADSPPAHDRVVGNIPIGAALEIIARGEGEAAKVARSALDKAGL